MRFGLLGTGYWARHTQGPALAEHPAAELVGVWGRDPAKAAAVAEGLGISAFADVDAMLEVVDAVAIALPPDVQADLALRAARAGRHLLLDKPLSLSIEAADRIVAEVRDRELASVVFFTNRFRPPIERFLRESAATGGWYAAHGTLYASIFQPGNPYGESPWRRREGGLWDLGPHALSVILPLLGPVVDLSAVDGPRDTVHLLLRHEAGAASTLSLTLDAAPDATASTFAYFGEHGTASLPKGDVTSVEAFGRAISTLVAEAQDGLAHPCDARFGREVVAVLAAADIARREQRIVRVAR